MVGYAALTPPYDSPQATIGLSKSTQSISRIGSPILSVACLFLAFPITGLTSTALIGTDSAGKKNFPTASTVFFHQAKGAPAQPST